MSDEMLDSIFVIGDADHCRKRVAAYAELGVTTAFVFPQGIHTTRDAAMESFVWMIEVAAPGPK